MLVNTRTRHGRFATALPGVKSWPLLRRLTGISGWVRNLDYCASMASGPFPGSFYQVSISLPTGLVVFLPRATELFGLAPLQGWQVGKTTSSRCGRSLQG